MYHFDRFRNCYLQHIVDLSCGTNITFANLIICLFRYVVGNIIDFRGGTWTTLTKVIKMCFVSEMQLGVVHVCVY